MLNKFAQLCLILALTSCAGPSVVRFQSTPPDAMVSLVDANGIATPIGKTPYVANESDIYRNGRYSQIQIAKEKYKSQEMLLTRSPMGGETSVSVQLLNEDLPATSIDQTATQEKIASSIARANGMIQAKQYAEAEAVMTNFVDQYPSISVGYDYLGNLNYLQKKFSKALKYYKKALSLNPQNAERRTIVEKLELITKNDSAGEVQ